MIFCPDCQVSLVNECCPKCGLTELDIAFIYDEELSTDFLEEKP